MNRGASEVPTVLGEQLKTAKPYYSIAELANILGDDYRRVADGLAASGAVMIYEKAKRRIYLAGSVIRSLEASMV